MSIAFPNASRSYDATRAAVRFWGSDSTIEAAFLITSNALRQMEPATTFDEASMLAAFDRHRAQICAAAAKAYSRGRKSYYELDVRDL
jgi:hypothetical protein